MIIIAANSDTGKSNLVANSNYNSYICTIDI